MNLDQITHGTVERPPRIILCGTEKIGKSTFATDMPNPVFLPIRREEGIDSLNVARFPVCESFADVQESLVSLCEGDSEYKTVVIDSVSALEPLVWQHTCQQQNPAAENIEKVGGGFGKGYVEAVSHWRDLMAALDYLRDNKGMATVLIAHVAVRTFQDPMGDGYDQYEIDINKKALSALLRWSDCVLFANSKTFTKTVKDGMKESKKGVMRTERCLFTQKRPSHPGGGRGVYGQLPYELELSYAAWEAAIAARKEEVK